MTTATKTMAPLDSPSAFARDGERQSNHARGERALKARLSEAHVLAAAIFRHYQATGQLENAACPPRLGPGTGRGSTTPVNPPTPFQPSMAEQVATAGEQKVGTGPTEKLSAPGGPASGGPVMRRLLADFQKALILDTARGLGFAAQSRKELTAEQLGRISTALRARMQELGIPEPEQSRPPERATPDQYRRLYKVIDKVERLPGWGGRAHTLNFIHRQTGRRAWPVRGLTRGQADAIERGLDGVLRHASKGEAEIMKRTLSLVLCLLGFALGAQATTVTGTIKDATGTAISSGSKVVFRLTQEGIAGGVLYLPRPAAVCQIIADGVVKDLAGTSDCIVQGNDVISPAGTRYEVRIITSGGDELLGARTYNITGATFDLGTATPDASAVVTAQAYQIVQDEGANVIQQTKLNFTGTGVACSNDAPNGRTNCSVTGGSTHSIDAVNLTTQDPINFQDTTEIDWTNPSAGNIQAALKAESVLPSKINDSGSSSAFPLFSGGVGAPGFRALADGDIPATIARDSELPVPGGTDTQVQFKDVGAFGGDPGFVFNKTTNIATLAGGLTLGDSSAASLIIASALSGATDPTLTFANNSIASSVPFTAPSFISSGAGGGVIDMTSGPLSVGNAGQVRIGATAGNALGVSENGGAVDTAVLLAKTQILTGKTLTSPIFGTQFTLDQTTADYTFTWANPAAGRAISIVDPGGTDVFAWRDATQTFLSKTLNGGIATTTHAAGANFIQLVRHATDCTAITDGLDGEACYEKDADALFVCEPTAGGCDTPAEWRSVGGAAGAPTGAQYVTLALDATLTAERTLDARDSLGLSDAGANGNISLDFDPADGATLFWLQDEFAGGAASTSGNIGSLGWSKQGIGPAGATAQGASAVNHPGVVRISSSTTADTGTQIGLDAGNNLLIRLDNIAGWQAIFVFRLVQTTDTRMRIGFMDDSPPVAAPTDGCFIRYDTDAAFADTNFIFECINNATTPSTTVDSTVAADTAWHALRIRSTTAGTILFKLDSGTEQSISADVPTSTLSPMFQIVTDATTAKSLDIDLFAMRVRNLSR